MIYKQCSYCGRRLPTGTKCPCIAQMEKARQKRYDQTKRNRKNYSFYVSEAWQKVRDICRIQCNNLDLFALYEHGLMIPGRLIHHIIPIEDDWDKRLMIDNTICVSDASHHEIHRQYDAGVAEKLQMQQKLISYKKRFMAENG